MQRWAGEAGNRRCSTHDKVCRLLRLAAQAGPHAAGKRAHTPAAAGAYATLQRSISPGASSPAAGRAANGGAACSSKAASAVPVLATRNVWLAAAWTGVAGNATSSGKSRNPRGPAGIMLRVRVTVACTRQRLGPPLGQARRGLPDYPALHDTGVLCAFLRGTGGVDELPAHGGVCIALGDKQSCCLCGGQQGLHACGAALCARHKPDPGCTGADDGHRERLALRLDEQAACKVIAAFRAVGDRVRRLHARRHLEAAAGAGGRACGRAVRQPRHGQRLDRHGQVLRRQHAHAARRLARAQTAEERGACRA